MEWEKPKFIRGRVDAAGRQLVDPSTSPEDQEVAWQIANNWRASHHYPLLATRMTLEGRAKRIANGREVAQRIKKLTSIETKLLRNPKMQLSQMQDLGGCRAIMPTLGDVTKLVEAYRRADTRNAKDEGKVCSKLARDPYDYIANPKADGYRGVHLVYKYNSANKDYEAFNGHRVEIQLRSRLQHYWATTVEVVDTIAQEGIKAGRGSADWRRFFALMSSAIARKEGTALVPETPSLEAELFAEISDLAERLQVDSRLRSYSVSVAADRVVPGSEIFLLTLDLNARKLQVTGFGRKDLAEANEALFAAEKVHFGDANYNSVLVGLDKLKSLKRAYPNYQLHTEEFLQFLQKIVAKTRREITAKSAQ